MVQRWWVLGVGAAALCACSAPEVRCPAGAACVFELAETDVAVDCVAADRCDVSCVAGTCGPIRCMAANRCGVVCGEGAACGPILCTRGGDCDVSCTAGATCAIECGRRTDCSDIRCTEGARCALQCRDTASCGFEDCDGEARTCGGGLVVCNQACPGGSAQEDENADQRGEE